MNKSIFHKILIYQTIENDIPTNLEEELLEWLDDVAGQYRTIVNDYDIDIMAGGNAVDFRVHGYDAHDNTRKGVYIITDLNGKVKVADPM